MGFRKAILKPRHALKNSGNIETETVGQHGPDLVFLKKEAEADSGTLIRLSLFFQKNQVGADCFEKSF